MSEMNRREFVVTATVAACGCAALTTSDALAFDPPKALKVGLLKTYTVDGITDKFAKAQRLMIIRNDGRLYASSAACTHRNCVVKKSGQELVCPCHGSTYSIQGTVTKPPASSSLVRYAISVDATGNVVVDKSKSFSEKDWDQEGAFIDLKKPATTKPATTKPADR